MSRRVSTRKFCPNSNAIRLSRIQLVSDLAVFVLKRDAPTNQFEFRFKSSVWRPGSYSFPLLSFQFLIICSFLLFPFFLLSFALPVCFFCPSHPFYQNIVPLRFVAGGRRRRPNLGLVCLWSPYGIGQTIYIFMQWFVLSLWSPYVIGQTIIFSSCLFFLLSFFPRLIAAVGDWMFTILWHMVWPYCEFRMQV